MKKLLSISILLMFIFLLGGRLIVNEILIIENRDHVLQSIRGADNHTDEVIFTMSGKEAKTRIDGNEVSYLHQRYDIILIEYAGDQVIIHALNDATENRLIAGMMDDYENFARQNPPGHKTPGNLLDDFFKEYTSCSGFKSGSDQCHYSWNSRSFCNVSAVLKGYVSLLKHPPRLLAS